MSRIVWTVKQLFPLTYRSHYAENGQKMFSVWRMWFGKVFDHEKMAVN
jgi:hypothetical protein